MAEAGAVDRAWGRATGAPPSSTPRRAARRRDADVMPPDPPMKLPVAFGACSIWQQVRCPPRFGRQGTCSSGRESTNGPERPRPHSRALTRAENGAGRQPDG
jgi:hypothetical protein